MFKIDPETNDISVTRGNSFEICVKPFIDDSEEAYIPASEDIILFSVKGSTGKSYIKKIIKGSECSSDGTITISVNPEDTLKTEPFIYYYDIMLVKQDGSAYTFIGRSKFTLLDAIGTIADIEKAAGINEN
ncbi:MAG: hypothetical protein ACI4I9_04545 [Porcipelethomonas sp.]